MVYPYYGIIFNNKKMTTYTYTCKKSDGSPGNYAEVGVVITEQDEASWQ
jgi:hypothetical protein